jgi:hypothetical protein
LSRRRQLSGQRLGDKQMCCKYIIMPISLIQKDILQEPDRPLFIPKHH